jgi:sulfate adenylyltransferase subunit 2
MVFDGLIAGIRRDEEATRAKERVFSPRGTEGGWDVRDQPPEFWDQFNASPPPGAHLRIHPILHWTEADIWAYTKRENIPIIPLYLAQAASAIARWAMPTSPIPWPRPRPASRKS